MFGIDFEEADFQQNAGGSDSTRSSNSFGTRSAYRGTVALKTLRRPKVKTLRQAYNTTVGEEQLVLAEDAGLEELLVLYKHEHPKVKGLASTVLSFLSTNAEDEVVVTNKDGIKPLFEMLEIKDEDVRTKAAITLSFIGEQAECQEAIVEAGGWDKIIPLISSRTAGLQHAGLLLCGSLVINSELRDSFIKEGGVAQVLKVAGSKDIKVQRAVATCLANLAQEAEAVKEVIAGDGLKKILHWIGQGDEELTGSSISILANASNNDHFKETLLQGRVVDVVPSLLLSQNETVRTGTLILLANLSTLEEAAVQIANTCLDNLLKVSKTSEKADTVYRTVVCFSNLAAFDQGKQSIRDKGVDTYLKQLHAENKDADIQKEVTQALAELGEFVKVAVDDDAEEGEEKEDEDDKGVKEELKQQIKALVDRLESETKESELEKIAAELQQILLHKKESHNILWLKNGFLALTERISAGDGQATPSQVNAIKALVELARYRKNRIRIGNSQVIPPLIRHLKHSSGNPQLALAILFILDDLTQKDTLLENFRLSKPLDALLVHLVGGGDVAHEEVQLNCLALIQRTVKNHVPSQVGFRVLSGFDTLVRLLGSPSSKVKEAAAHGLAAACSGQRRMQQAAAKAKAIKFLVPLLQAKEELRVRHAACAALSQIIQQDQANQEKLRKENGAVEGIIDLFTVSGATPDPKNPQGPTVEQQVQWIALYAAGNFVYLYSKGQNAVRNKKGIAPVLELLKEPAVALNIKEQATRFLCYLCFYNSKNQELIGTPAVAAAIVDCLGRDSRRLQYYSEGLIWSLAHSNKKRRATLVDAGAIGALLELAQSPSEAVAKGAEWAKQALTKK